MKDCPFNEGIIDPYSGKRIKPGKKVTCHTSSTGVTLCKLNKRESHAWPIVSTIIALSALLFLFSIKIEVTIGSHVSQVINMERFVQSFFIIIPVISIVIGTGVGIWFMSRRSKFNRKI